MTVRPADGPSDWPIFATFWMPMTRATMTSAPTMASAIRDWAFDGESGAAARKTGTGGSSSESGASSRASLRWSPSPAPGAVAPAAP